MTVKKRVWISVGWTVFVIAVGVLITIKIHSDAGSRREAMSRATKLGSGLGAVVCVGYGIIWIPYAMQVGQRKREEREAAERKKGKRRRR